MVRTLLWLVLLLTAASPAWAEEQILSFDSRIEIRRDGSMDVTETIRVRAEGVQIQRGIYRDFPTEYRGGNGLGYRVKFEVLGATRDGEVENWFTEPQENGTRVYLGKPEVYLDPGEYAYELRYRTDRQLGYFEKHDELYWNVTGNGWVFPILRASATVMLPAEVDAGKLKVSGYTGLQGSTATDLTAKAFLGGARFATTTMLESSEGLTIVLEFPKGIVVAPTSAQRARWILADNVASLVGVVGLALLWWFYARRWNAVGRDPETGPRMPIYEPPAGQSAASMRFVRRMGYDDACFASAALALASKGALTIEKDEDEIFILRRVEGSPSTAISKDEKGVLDGVFHDASNVCRLDKKDTSQARHLKSVRSAHESGLTLDNEKRYFVLNLDTLWRGIGLSVLVQVLMALVGPNDPVAAIMVGMFFSGMAFLAYACFVGITASGSLVVGVFMGVMIGIFPVFLLFGLADMAGVVPAVLLTLMLLTNIAFYHWMKAPTREGATLLQQIEGFRWYLGVAEKQELDARHRPESNPKLFGLYLPYALALDVEQDWAERFSEALTPAQFEEARPTWYRDMHSARSAKSFVSSGFGKSFSSSISSASTPPGSSSGSGGGGRSGGGGGGGGGGGW